MINNKNVTDLNYWINLTPTLYVFPYSDFISFILLIRDLYTGKDRVFTDDPHPFGYADLYVSGICKDENAELSVISDEVITDRTITFCMEIADSMITEWTKNEV